VAVISRTMADKHFSGRDPLGRRFRTGGPDAPWVTVVGVSGDVINQWFGGRNIPTVYRPFVQDPVDSFSFAVRVDGDPDGLIGSARQAIAGVDADVPAFGVRSLRRSIRISTIGLQYVAGIMSVFSALAFVLALSGIYGVMSYRVSLRTQEFGVRLALGASPSDVLKLTLRRAALVTALGLVVGGGLGYAGAQTLSSVLQGAVPFQGTTFATLVALLGGAALAAAFVPARRALAIDPARTLRGD
jgi:ABC-type antimicrobial peptide transport system permease subunit